MWRNKGKIEGEDGLRLGTGLGSRKKELERTLKLHTSEMVKMTCLIWFLDLN